MGKAAKRKQSRRKEDVINVAIKLGRETRFYRKFKRNYSQIKNYIDYQSIVALLSFNLWALEQAVEGNTAISILQDRIGLTTDFLAWELLNNPFPVYWLDSDLLLKLKETEPLPEDLSLQRRCKSGVILFPDKVIKAPGGNYLQWIIFVHEKELETLEIKIKNFRVYDREKSEALTEQLAWATVLSNGVGYAGTMDLNESRELNKLVYSPIGLDTLPEKNLMKSTFQILVQLLKYLDSDDAIDNKSLAPGQKLEPLWLK